MAFMLRRDGKTVVEEISHADLEVLIKEQADREKEAESAAH